MYKSIPILNPSRPAKQGKTKRKKTMAAKKRGRKKTHNAAPVKRAASGSKSKTAKRRHHNPNSKYEQVLGHLRRTHNSKKRHHHRRHHNPDVPAAYNPMNLHNAMEYTLGTAAGALGAPVIGTVLNKQFGLTGIAKYGAQAVIVFLAYYFGKKFAPKAALSFLITGTGVSLYQYFQESGILNGTEQLLGLSNNTPDFSQRDISNLRSMAQNINNARLRGIVPSRVLNGIVPNNRQAVLNGIVPSAMSPMRSAASRDGSRMSAF